MQVHWALPVLNKFQPLQETTVQCRETIRKIHLQEKKTGPSRRVAFLREMSRNVGGDKLGEVW